MQKKTNGVNFDEQTITNLQVTIYKATKPSNTISSPATTECCKAKQVCVRLLHALITRIRQPHCCAPYTSQLISPASWVQGCSPKKEKGGRLKQDLDKDLVT